MNAPTSIIKRCLRFLLKIVLGLSFLVLSGYFSIVVCPLIWPSLSNTVHEPKSEDFCGRYIPMPDTANYLKKKYPDAQAWMDFNQDGTFVFNDIPTRSSKESGNETETKNGKWTFRANGRRVIIVLSENEEPFLYSGLHIKGRNPPYIIEDWRDFSMEFCTNPQQSHAVREYKSLSITDFAIQGVFVLSVFVLPFFLRPGSGLRSFGFPFLIIFAWGFWRLAYFDSTTHNDIPGMGYIVCAFGYALIARGIFGMRCIISRGRSKHRDRQTPPPHPNTTPSSS